MKDKNVAVVSGAKKSAAARIFLVDDHPVVRSGLVELINQEKDMVVCGEASSAEEALGKISQEVPDLVVVDLSLEGTSGLELLKSLKIRDESLPVLVLSMHDETLYAERALRAGAKGYLMKNAPLGQLQQAIREVLAGRVHLSPRMTEQILHSLSGPSGAASPLDRLSDREMEVFEMIGRGLGTTEIARKLHLSVKTVETYRGNIKDKLALKDAAQLVQHAVQWVQTL
jgi:DNA-binding NarL/FixJ family response regulator